MRCRSVACGMANQTRSPTQSDTRNTAADHMTRDSRLRCGWKRSRRTSTRRFQRVVVIKTFATIESVGHHKGNHCYEVIGYGGGTEKYQCNPLRLASNEEGH